MKHTLQRLVDLASFDTLQKKLERWLDSYSYNTCDENVERCLEVIELNSAMQSQLLDLLRISAAEGGRYGGSESLKKRLMPWLSHAASSSSGFFAPSGVAPPVRADAAALRALSSDLAAKDRQLTATEDMYERTVQDLEDDLNSTQAEADQLKEQLDEKSEAFDALKRQSSTDKMLTEVEIQQLRDRIRYLEDELLILRPTTKDIFSSLEYHENDRRLKDESDIFSPLRISRLLEDPESVHAVISRKTYSKKSGGNYVTDRLRVERLINAFNDLSTIGRMDAEKILRRYTDDKEQVHKIIFAVMQESFSVARVAFLEHKMRIRSTLSSIHSGPDSLEYAVQDYINRYPDSYDLPAMSSDVVRGLKRRSGLFLSPEVSFNVIHPFIREACQLAWAMNALNIPLELAPAASLELYDSSKYRRSYDSDYEAGLVAYHIWPCLMQEYKVLVKGEAHTARASTANLRSLSSNRTESASVVRLNGGSRSPHRTTAAAATASRSRSASPKRRGTSPKLDDVSSQSRTASSSLSHYGIYT